MHAYSCQLVHSMTLIAQPRSKTPFAKVSAMKTGKYEPRNSGTFGVMWFTDFGDKFWEACQGVDDSPKLRLRECGFDEMDWSVSFRFAGFKARITSVKYKGFFGKPGNSYMELKIGTHPETNAQFLVKLDQLSSRFSEVVLSNTSLNRILDEAYCCVVFGSSTTGVASIFKGVPIISLNNTNVYKNVTNTLENIENLNYNIDLTDWRNTLGYSMWHISEFESGEAWDYILK